MSLTFEYAEPLSYNIYRRLLKGDSTTGQKGMPKGKFYFTDDVLVPFSYYPTNFILKTTELNVPIIIHITRSGELNVATPESLAANRFSLVPTDYHTTIPLQLGKNKNEIKITQNDTIVTLIVNAVSFATLLQSYSDEFFNNAVVGYDNQYNAIFNDYATRLVEPLLPISNLFPDVRTLQLLATKMIIREYVSEQSTQVGVTDFLAGLVQSTPYFLAQKNKIGLDPSIVPIFRNQEDFAGMEAHVWIPNVSIVKWVAFTHFINNIKNAYKLIKVTESEVIIEVDEQLHNHRFDLDAEEASLFFLDIERSCYDNFRAFISIASTVGIRICAAGYTFDLIVQASNPLFGFNLDYDNFVGLSLTNRLDGSLALDTMSQPATSSSCVYPNGYFTQTVLLANMELEAPISIVASGSYDYTFIAAAGFGAGPFATSGFGT